MVEFLQNSPFLLAVIAFGVVLIPAIIIHELGHFLAAKMVGISVLEFGVGFPPRLARLFVWKETEFTLNWLPIGGFVRPLGEDFLGPSDESAEKPKNGGIIISDRDELRARGVPDEQMRSVNETKPLPRIWFFVAGAMANFVSAILVFMLVALIGLPTVIGARAQLVAIPGTSPLRSLGVEVGDAVEQIDGERFQSVQTFWSMFAASAGRDVVLTMRSLQSNESYEVTVPADSSDLRGNVLVTTVVQGAPGDLSGLKPGDLITSVNGEPLDLNDPVGYLQGLTVDYAGRELLLGISRDGTPSELTLVPRENPPPGQGRIGISISSVFSTAAGLQIVEAQAQEELVSQPLDVAVSYGFSRTWETIVAIVNIPSQLMSGAISPEEARPVSIVGISQVGGQFLQRSIEQGSPILILNFFALISIFLGFTNLLPLPPLDGGRVLFVVIEMLRGKPVPFRIENMVHQVGMILLLSLGLLVIFYDILNPLRLPN